MVEPELTGETIPDRLAGDSVEVLVVRSTKVTAAAIEAGKSVGMIVRAGAGTDNVDKAAASAHGVYVANVPGKNAIAVAELAMALLLAIDRHVATGTADLRNGVWNKGAYSDADGIYGKQLAIIGLGEIGFALAERARAFGMTVTALRRDRSDAALARVRSGGIRLVETMDELLAEADVVSLHVPKADDTVGMCNTEFFAKMRDGAVFLNTSRGEVVDAGALIEAMDTKGIRAGLDVWPDEPAGKSGDWVSPLSMHPNVVGTHHIGASTEQAQDAIARGTVEVIEAYAKGSIMNPVNMLTKPAGMVVLTVRHLDKVGVLAKVFATLRAADLNVQQMQNQLFEGGVAAVASINLAREPDHAILEAMVGDDDVLGVSVSTGHP